MEENVKENGILKEFTMTLRSVTHDKKAGTLRWKAVASDTDEDWYGDNMSLELFNDFTKRISNNEFAPEEFRSSFWQGGMPYISISHYPDLEGKAVPGSVERVFVDGDQLKADGQFNKNKLGFACYYAICKDLYEEPKADEPVRVSIAFLDHGHTHKSDGYEFIRENINDVCLRCIEEYQKGEKSGKIFNKGQLVHLALTRVPANDRTSMEVEKSMATRKEDAVSIVGEELAEEFDKEAKLVGKSQALIIKSDEEDEVEIPEDLTETKSLEEVEVELIEDGLLPVDKSTATPDEDVEKVECSDEAKEVEKSEIIEPVVDEKEVEKSMDEPVPVVVVEEYEPVKPYGGATSMSEAKAYMDAQKERWRISDLWWAFQSIMDNILSSDDATDKPALIAKAADDLKNMIGDQSVQMYALLEKAKFSEPHELDTVFATFKASYDEVKASDIATDEKLHLLQESFTVVGTEVRKGIEEIKEVTPEKVTGDNAQMENLALIVQNLTSKVDLLLTQQQQVVKLPVENAPPVRRNMQANLSMQQDISRQPTPKRQPSETPLLRALIDHQVGLAQ